MYCYNRRKGIAWQNDLYLSLLQHVKIKNIPVSVRMHDNISTEQLQNLSKAVFPKYGCRKEYQEKVRYFLQCYHEIVIKDLSNLNKNSQSINAPELQLWIDYKKKLVKSMCLSSIRQDIEKFLIDVDYKLPLDVRRTILHQIYGIKENADIELQIMKTLNNCLWYNRKEICSEVQLAIPNKSSTNLYENQNNYFRGFTKKELSTSISARNILLAIESKLDSAESTAVVTRVLLDSSNVNRIYDISIPETNENNVVNNKKSLNQSINNLKKLQRRSDLKRDKISQHVFQLFRQKDVNDQLQLMKKLIIFNVVSPNNDALKKFMDGTGRINRSTKKMILEIVYEENVEESHYALLELLILKRYLIKQKVKDMRCFLKMNNINFKKEIEGMIFFCDVEAKFYEVLQNISFMDNQ